MHTCKCAFTCTCRIGKNNSLSLQFCCSLGCTCTYTCNFDYHMSWQQNMYICIFQRFLAFVMVTCVYRQTNLTMNLVREVCIASSWTWSLSSLHAILMISSNTTRLPLVTSESNNYIKEKEYHNVIMYSRVFHIMHSCV